MKVYEIKAGAATVDGLQAAQRLDPQPAPREVLIRLHAASLNYRDLMIITGRYFGGPVNRDVIPLSDGAGEVAAVGSGVTRFKRGDRVAATFFQVWVDGVPTGRLNTLGAPLDGMLAEFIAVNEDGAVAIPPGLSFEEAATLPCAGVTAWNALMHAGKPVRPGDTVLTLGTGGVSMFALQFARAAGARVIMTSSSDEKIERAVKLGASEGINYKRTPEWEKEVHRLTAGRGVQHVVENGGAGTLARSMQCVGFGGKIALIGVLAGPGDTSPHPLMFKHASLHGIYVGSRAMFERMNEAIEVNQIKPVIDKVFPFDAAGDAYRLLASGNFMGKIVIRI